MPVNRDRPSVLWNCVCNGLGLINISRNDRYLQTPSEVLTLKVNVSSVLEGE